MSDELTLIDRLRTIASGEWVYDIQPACQEAADLIEQLEQQLDEARKEVRSVAISEMTRGVNEGLAAKCEQLERESDEARKTLTTVKHLIESSRHNWFRLGALGAGDLRDAVEIAARTLGEANKDESVHQA